MRKTEYMYSLDKDNPRGVIAIVRQGNNELCRCGSGKKFKRCCKGKKWSNLTNSSKAMKDRKERYKLEMIKNDPEMQQMRNELNDLISTDNEKDQTDKKIQ